MNKWLGAVCLALSFGSAPVRAQDADSNLRRAVAVIPADTLSPTAADMAWFYDVSVLAALHGGQLDGSTFRRMPGAYELRPVAALAASTPDAWRAKTGIDPAQLRFFTQFGQPPQSVTHWGLADETATAAVIAALPQQGFAPAPDAPDIFANGEAGTMNLAQADQADPWRGRMGQTSAVTGVGAGLLHATDPTVLAAVRDGAKMADTPFGATLLAALEAQDGQVLQAVFYSPHFGLAARSDPARMTAPDALPQAGQAAEQGVPLYGGLAMADVVTAGGSDLVIAYAYTDCETADAAAATAATLWPESAGGNATPSHAETAGAGCAAVITVPGGENGRQFDRAIRALMMRDLAAIHIVQE